MQKKSKQWWFFKELLKINFLAYFRKGDFQKHKRQNMDKSNGCSLRQNLDFQKHERQNMDKSNGCSLGQNLDFQKHEEQSAVKQGSITLFFALTLTLILSFLFSLLEASRVETLAVLAQRNLSLSLESAFGSYHIPLWQDYQMLFLDGGSEEQKLDMALLEGTIMQESWKNQIGSSFYHMALRNLEITGYTLATDYYGVAFEEQACKAIQAQLAQNVAESFQEKLKKGKRLAEDRQSTQEKWKSAKNAVKEAEKIETEKAETEKTEAEIGKIEAETIEAEDETETKNETGGSEKYAAKPVQQLPENPINFVDLWKKSPILTLVVEDTTQISGKTIAKAESLKNREKEIGNMEASDKKGTEKLWFIQYLNHYFSCQNQKGEGGSKQHALDYELEYCIGGKATDQENLEKVVNELLLLRETGNFTTIMQDSQKQALALEIATAAVGFTGIPPLIQAVQIGILLAWSFIESILDIRCLLAGGTVPLVKNISEWKSDVSLGHKAIETKTENEQKKDGLSYREYLQILLLLVKEELLVYRAMDIIEQNVKLLPEEENFRMDYLIHKVKVEGTYTSRPLFLGFVTNVKVKDGEYCFNNDSKFSY